MQVENSLPSVVCIRIVAVQPEVVQIVQAKWLAETCQPQMIENAINIRAVSLIQTAHPFDFLRANNRHFQVNEVSSDDIECFGEGNLQTVVHLANQMHETFM